MRNSKLILIIFLTTFLLLLFYIIYLKAGLIFFVAFFIPLYLLISFIENWINPREKTQKLNIFWLIDNKLPQIIKNKKK